MKSKWLSVENLKWLLGTLAIPATLALLNWQYQSAQTERQANEARLRLYTELLSRREEADTNLRKGIFDKVLERFLKEGQTVNDRLVALELLSINFNDSLDLSPLFWQIFRELQKPEHKSDFDELISRLKQASVIVKTRQIALLETAGERVEKSLNLDSLQNSMYYFLNADLTLTDPDDPDQIKHTRHFDVRAIDYDLEGHRVFFSIKHYEPPDGKPEEVSFWVDEFDFPLSNFSRISKSERFALVMRDYIPPIVRFNLVYFPSSRAGVKDKPYIDEVVSSLKRDTTK